MMNLLNKILPSLALVILSASAAHADLWQGAGVHQRGSGSLGAFGQLYFSPSEFQAYAQGQYGFGSNFQGEVKVGAGTLDPYVGGFVKYHILSAEVLSLAAWGGMHYQNVAALDFALMMSHSFKHFELYLNPLLQLPLSGGGSAMLNLVPGFDLHVARQLKLYVEFSINLANSYNAGSAGVRWEL